MAFPRYVVAASWPFAELMASVGFLGGIGPQIGCHKVEKIVLAALSKGRSG
jgi:hypothetical protein